MAKAWKDVIASPQYQALTEEQKAQAQAQYFDEVVAPKAGDKWAEARDLNRPDFPGECFICELRLPDHCFRWKHNELFLLLPEEYGPAFPA
ncbi:hypothetical protein, partial [Escherichia coli]|uniref:hypothetical protein n=1 Tax=Escherichia coli TaxID=562 RepID=UPI001C0B13FA